MRAGSDLDAALIDASRNGDCSAFGQIVERYQHAVYAVSFSDAAELADDVTPFDALSVDLSPCI